MQFNEKYILFASKNRQIRYIFTIFFANFLFVYSVHIFCFYSQKMFHTTQKSHLPDEITFYVFIW